MNSKLQTVTDAAGCPLRMFLTEGQRSDYISARALLNGHPLAEHMLADSGYDADWYREALEDKGITPCIPSRKNRKVPIPHDEARYSPFTMPNYQDHFDRANLLSVIEAASKKKGPASKATSKK